MTQSQRKLAGTVLILLLLALYPLLALQVYVTWLTGAPWWGVIGFSVVAGMAWAVPAGLVIRWMAKP